MGKLMSGSFVIVHLDVQENPDKKALENAGGEDLMKSWHGSGLPFLVVLDPNGKVLADSNLTGKYGSNIGYPAKPEEIGHFVEMLSKAPAMTDAQRDEIRSWLTAHAPKA